MNGILKTFGFAWKGLVLAFQTQRNIRIHSLISLVSLLGAWYFQISKMEWLLIFLAMGLVFGMECMNTSLEELTNLVSPQFDIRAGKVKDLAAGAVLIASIFAFLIGMIIFFPRVWSLVMITFRAH